MNKLALFLVLALVPAPAGAIPYTVLQGPDVPISDKVDESFPRYDLIELCKRAWPGERLTTQARDACETRQKRLAGLASRRWNDLSAPARQKCIERADSAGSMPYYVLYTCLNAALFTIKTQDVAKNVANVIRKQNGMPPLDTLPVGSIK